MSTGTQKINLPKTLCFLVSGKAGVGKTTFSNFLIASATKMGYNSILTNLAKSLKQYALSLGWDGVKDAKGRKFLQDLGQVVRRYDKDTWVRNTVDYLLEHDDYPFDIVAIDDWRFPNESAYLIEHEPLYQVVKVRILAPGLESLRGTPEYDDVSETSLDKEIVDWEVYNLDSLEELRKNSEQLLYYTIEKIKNATTTIK